MKSALITGIAGQDGAYLSRYLLDNGYHVYGVDKNRERAAFKNLIFLGVYDRVDILQVDLTDFNTVKETIEQIAPDEIYNLAAQSSVGLSFRQPKDTIGFNLLSTLNILESIRCLGCKTKFYQASSSEMFGNVSRDKLPLKEASVFHPASPYAVSKTASHWATVNYRESFGIYAACGILFNHESVLRGDDFVTKKIINTAVKISQGAERELVLGNMRIFRDWGYAPEYVKAMWLMLQQERPDDYIVCSGSAHSLEEFVKLVFEKLGLDHKKYLRIDRSLFRPSELEIIWGDNSKAKRVLGWKYDYSFESLIEKLVLEEIEFVKAGAGNAS